MTGSAPPVNEICISFRPCSNRTLSRGLPFIKRRTVKVGTLVLSSRWMSEGELSFGDGVDLVRLLNIPRGNNRRAP